MAELNRAASLNAGEPSIDGDLMNPQNIEEANRIRQSRGLPPLDPNNLTARQGSERLPRWSLGGGGGSGQNPGRVHDSSFESTQSAGDREARKSTGSDRTGRMSDGGDDALADAAAAVAACAAGAPIQPSDDKWVATFEMRRESREGIRQVQENCNW
mmetsp:Transcript_33205/g.83795  ORF Transcript_33205/g.83795 Transcript_33205/m.83795 type:complete len:157 (+) Transcript_33205:242-712(+)